MLLVDGEQTVGEMKHGTDLSGRAAGNVEKSQQLGSGTAFESFGDIIGDGEGGAAQLVTKVARLSEKRWRVSR